MRAARWVVIGTALVAAATAFHMLMSPDGGSRSGGRSQDGASSGSSRAVDGSNGAPPRGGPPLDEIDAESREAMRKFLRESARDENGK